MAELPPPPSEPRWQPPPGWYSSRYPSGPRLPGGRLWGCLGAGTALVVLVIAVGVVLTHGAKVTVSVSGPKAVAIPPSSPTNAPVTCPPQPCADAGGEILAVRVVGRDLRPDPADDIPPEARLIALELTFRNRTAETRTVFTSDLELRDGAGLPSESVYTRNPACRLWVRVDLAPGGTSAPRTLCFAVRARTPGPLRLSWAPVLGQTPVDVPLG